jgi:hypothetical protein
LLLFAITKEFNSFDIIINKPLQNLGFKIIYSHKLAHVKIRTILRNQSFLPNQKLIFVNSTDLSPNIKLNLFLLSESFLNSSFQELTQILISCFMILQVEQHQESRIMSIDFFSLLFFYSFFHQSLSLFELLKTCKFISSYSLSFPIQKH